MGLGLLTLVLKGFPSPNYALKHQPMGPTSKEVLGQKG